MNAYDLLFHLERHFATELGTRAVKYLTTHCASGTASFRAVLACAALRAVGTANVPEGADDMWRHAAYELTRGEVASATLYVPAAEAAKPLDTLATITCPAQALRLVCNTWEAVRRAERRYVAERRDGLRHPRTADRAGQLQHEAAAAQVADETGLSDSERYRLAS